MATAIARIATDIAGNDRDRGAGCRRLVLVHLAPEVDGTPIEAAVRAAYAGPLALASDGWSADI